MSQSRDDSLLEGLTTSSRRPRSTVFAAISAFLSGGQSTKEHILLVIIPKACSGKGFAKEKHVNAVINALHDARVSAEEVLLSISACERSTLTGALKVLSFLFQILHYCPSHILPSFVGDGLILIDMIKMEHQSRQIHPVLPSLALCLTQKLHFHRENPTLNTIFTTNLTQSFILLPRIEDSKINAIISRLLSLQQALISTSKKILAPNIGHNTFNEGDSNGNGNGNGASSRDTFVGRESTFTREMNEDMGGLVGGGTQLDYTVAALKPDEHLTAQCCLYPLIEEMVVINRLIGELLKKKSLAESGALFEQHDAQFSALVEIFSKAERIHFLSQKNCIPHHFTQTPRN